MIMEYIGIRKQRNTGYDIIVSNTRPTSLTNDQKRRGPVGIAVENKKALHGGSARQIFPVFQRASSSFQLNNKFVRFIYFKKLFGLGAIHVPILLFAAG